MKASVLLILCVVSLAPSAAAQVPQWTAELTAGAGRHSNRVGATWYFDDPEGVVRVGLAYRVAGNTTRAVVAKLDYLTDGGFGDKTSCAGTPTGGCYNNFHPGRGASIALGVRQELAAPLAVGAAAGLGQYGHGAGGDGVRPYIEGEVFLRVAPHVAVIGLARYVRWTTSGTSYWFAPLMAGLQIH
jgi:hypothetical protein